MVTATQPTNDATTAIPALDTPGDEANPTETPKPADSDLDIGPWLLTGALTGLAVWATLLAVGGLFGSVCLHAAGFAAAGLILAGYVLWQTESASEAVCAWVCILCVLAGAGVGIAKSVTAPGLPVEVKVASGIALPLLGSVIGALACWWGRR